jgi:hypothetical protein
MMASIKSKLSLLMVIALGTTSLATAADPESKITQTKAAITNKQVDTQTQELKSLVNDAVRITSRRFLTADVHTPWQIMHGILALRKHFEIKVDGKKVSALDWLAKGQQFRGSSMIERSEHGGRFHRFTKPYHFEGHPNQFLAILTMSELPATHQLKTSTGESVSITQMLENAKMTVNDREEITWTLWSLARYLPIDSEWINAANEPWSIERLVQIQTYAEPNDAACGGTHGLFALSIARNAYVFSGKPLRGIWLEADQKIKRYVAESKALQNPDGTFSTVYFSGPGQSSEFSKRIASSGHILEFLMVALSDKQLKEAWVQRSIRAVAKDLVDHKQDAADCGPLYHALHALVLYQQRTGQPIFAPKEPTKKPVEAKPAKQPEVEKVETTTTDSAVFKPTAPKTPLAQPTSPVAPRKLPVKPQQAVQQSPDVTTLRNVLNGAKLPEPLIATPTIEEPSIGTSSTQTIISESVDVQIDKKSTTIVEVARRPEDNAPIIRETPMIMEDGYEVPLPPTSD